MYDAISKILKHEEKLNDICNKLSIPLFKKIDIQYLSEYCILMEPVAATLDFLQQEENLLYGYFLPALVTLKTKLNKIILIDKLKLLKQIAVQMQQSLAKRFQKYFALEPEADEAIVAAVLCPSLKMKWIKPLLTKESYRSVDDITALVVEFAKKLATSEGEVLKFTEVEPKGQDSFFDFDDMG